MRCFSADLSAAAIAMVVGLAWFFGHIGLLYWPLGHLLKQCFLRLRIFFDGNASNFHHSRMLHTFVIEKFLGPPF